MTNETVVLLYLLGLSVSWGLILLWAKCALFSDYKNEDGNQSQDAKIN